MSRMNIVSTSVWQVLTFALNGIVFVLLGTQLPQSFGGLWIEDGISNVD
jgi:CPA1 family monovalent cation:H+ antiporter